MNQIKVGFKDSLAKHIVETGKCLGCGACVVICPFNCLKYVDEKPRLVKECKVCGICARACPQFELFTSEIENFVFGRERTLDEEFGIYRRLVVAQSTEQEILNVCQDGGIVTALLLFALSERIIDGAIVTEKNKGKPFYPRPALATTTKEILQSAGTKYFYSPTILVLKKIIKRRKADLAFVGTPCQVRAIRKMQMMDLKKYVASLKFLIGLLCSHCFIYDGLMENYVHRKLGIDLKTIKKIDIKGNMLIKLDSETVRIPLAETKDYARQGCHFCQDFSSELADISVGALGLEGWNIVIVRTEKGEELFNNAEKAGAIRIKDVGEDAHALKLLNKLSAKKRQVLGGR
jgi:coenzyme F420 hydrogenase subunit beta